MLFDRLRLLRLAVLTFRGAPHPVLQAAKPPRGHDQAFRLRSARIFLREKVPPQPVWISATPVSMVAQHRPLGVVVRHRSARSRRTRLDHHHRVCFGAAASRRCSPAANCDRNCPNRDLPGCTIRPAVPAQRRCGTIPVGEDCDRTRDRGGVCRADRWQQDDRAYADNCVAATQRFAVAFSAC